MSANAPEIPFKCDLGFSRKGIIGLLPILVLFDFAAAFPSISHKWLKAVLKACRVPQRVS